jgi:site-specific DNA-methyltransferase (adenine-specific)
MLTKRQKQVLDFIKNYKDKHDYAPSLEEIKKHLRLSSVSTAHYHVQGLQNMGYLRKEENQPRALDVFSEQKLVQIPILGTIAAGLPIEAIENKENIAVPQFKLKNNQYHFALRVQGKSMLNENINDGDIVIVKSQPTAENGQKVVALIDNQEVTLKKIYKEKDHVRLEPANPQFESIFVPYKNIQIQGVVVDIIKTLQEPDRQVCIETNINQRTQPKESLSIPNPHIPIDKIIKGDAIENMRKLPSNSIDLIIADPPYNLSKGNKWAWDPKSNLPGFGGAWNKVIESWDNMPLAEYFSFTMSWASEAKRILKPTGSMWVFGTYHNIGVMNTILQLLSIEIINEIIWYKRNSFPNLSGRRLTASHETLLWAHVGNKKRSYYFNYKFSKDFSDPTDMLKIKHKQMRTIWDIPNNKDPEELKFGRHPTQKPLRVCRRIISLASKTDDTILAPFAGAGSECVAAKFLRRHYIGFEIDNQYIEIAEKRLRNVK